MLCGQVQVWIQVKCIHPGGDDVATMHPMHSIIRGGVRLHMELASCTLTVQWQYTDSTLAVHYWRP